MNMNINWDGAFMTPEQAKAHQAQLERERAAFLAKQKEPGYVPPGWERWTMETISRLPANDDRRIRLMRALVNNEEIDLQAILRGDA